MPGTSSEDLGHSFRVTVIIPCHNHASFLARSVESVVTQDYSNKNIVIVNDGSSDNSLEVAVGLSEKHENIFVINNDEPTGPSAARNKAIREMWEYTDFYCMLDADDSYLPGKISKSVDVISKDPYNIGLVYADVLLENTQTGTITLEIRHPYSREELERHCMISNTPLINKHALDSVGLYDEDMRTAEDWDLWLRITERFVAVHIPEPLSTYSITGFNSSDTVSQDVWQQNWAKIRQRIGLQHA